MPSPFLSIIIPVYNASKDIGRCLDSIWIQCLCEDEFEVVCVDDCSTDNSCEVISAIQKAHPNLRLLRNALNLRAGGARNHGIRAACGEFVIFIDADDYFHLGALKHSIDHLNKNSDLDILTCNFARELPGQPSEKFVHQYNSTEKLSVSEYIGINGFIPCSPWQWFFRKSLMTNNNIWFREHTISEDVDWTHALVLHAQEIQYQPILLTHYVLGADSQTALSYAKPANVYAYIQAGKCLYSLRKQYEAIGQSEYLLGMSAGYIQQGLKYFLMIQQPVREKSKAIKELIPLELTLNRAGRIARRWPRLYSFATNCLCPLARTLQRWRSKRAYRGIHRQTNKCQ